MSENLFKNSTCPIEPTPKVDFNFILACDITPPPPPIYGCQPPIIPREPPLPPCPDFSTQTSVNVGFAGGGCPAGNNKVTVTRTDTDPCRYDMDLDLNIPIPRIPCPAIKPGNFDIKVGYTDCLDQRGEIKITTNHTPGDCNTPNKCEFTIDLDVQIPIPPVPCPQIFVNNFNVISGYADALGGAQSRFEVNTTTTPGDCNTPNQCQFDFDVAIVVPIPLPPCPIFQTKKTDVVIDYDVPNFLTLNIRKCPVDPNNPNDPNRQFLCCFELELVASIPIPKPPCTTVWLQPELQELSPDSQPFFKALEPIHNFNPGYNCETILPLVAGFPRGVEPIIEGGTGIAKFVPCDYPPTTTIVARRVGYSHYELTSYVDIPKCPPSCPEITFNASAVAATSLYANATVTPSITLEKVENVDGGEDDIPTCTYELGLEIGVPVCNPVFDSAPKFATGTIFITEQVSPEPYIYFSIDPVADKHCTYAINGFAYLPRKLELGDVTISPAGVGTGQLSFSEVDGKLNLAINLNTTTCADAGSPTVLPMTAAPFTALDTPDLTADTSLVGADIARSPAFVDEFINQLRTNAALRSAVKAVLDY